MMEQSLISKIVGSSTCLSCGRFARANWKECPACGGRVSKLDTDHRWSGGVVQTAYNLVRPHLPRRLSALNGVVARRARLLDATDHAPDYEAALVDALRTHVADGDRVVVVGGGLGVTTVVAAEQGGRVIAYEAGRERYEICRETIRINGVGEQADAQHALVGPAVSVNGELADRQLRPDELPACDVLEIDAEGSEVAILKGLEQLPRVVIVESHRDLGTPVNDVWLELDRMGYEVVDQESVDREKGICVLTAVRERGEAGGGSVRD